jgi:hypothetical protein
MHVNRTTRRRSGIVSAHGSRMPDFLQLVRRDHDDLEAGLRELVRPMLATTDLRTTLDGVRLGLTAHAEAEDIVLYGALAHDPPPAFVQQIVAEARRAHLEQESALASLVCAMPETAAWRTRAQHLHELVRRHAAHEEQTVIPALREHIPMAAYASLAGKFATERMRQLAMLQPSAVYATQEVEQRLASAG